MSFKSKKNKVCNTNIWTDFYNLPSKTRYVSGTDIKNFILNDPILDFFKVKTSNISNNHNSYSNLSESNNSVSEPNILFNEGNKFEEDIVQKLSKKFQVITINKSGKYGYNKQNMDKTVEAINNKVEIIHSGVIFSEKYGIGGIPDLIVRGDILNKITKNKYINEDKIINNESNPQINTLDKYYIVDIKWTTIYLCTTDNLIRNNGLFPAYKGQLAIYTFLLGLIQDYIPKKAYILGKDSKIDHSSNDHPDNDINNKENKPFALLGVIDYETFDYTYIKKTIDGINWIHKVREEGKDWDMSNIIDLYKTSNINLFPNCKNTYDTPYSKIKDNIAKELGEITQLWNVSSYHRDMALSKGIYSIWDNNLTAEKMGINGKNSVVINSIINLNKPSNNLKYSYSSNNFKQYLTDKNCNYFFVDFETINFGEISDILYMIGIGYIHNDNFIFKQFTCNELSSNEEKRITQEFIYYVKNIINSNQQCKNYKLIHWGNAEVDIINRVLSRHPILHLDVSDLIWFNLYKLFIDYNIVIRDAFNFKLKTICNSLYKYDLINERLDNNVLNGLDAMIQAIEYYKNNKNNEESNNKESNNKESNNEIIKNIMKYNEKDCILMYEIYKFLLRI